MITPDQFSELSTYFLAKEAENLGIKVKKIFTKGILAKKSFLSLKYNKHHEIIVGQRTSQTSVIAYWLQKNKYLTKYFLRENGIRVAQGEIFKIHEKNEIVSYAKKIGLPVVLKQTSGTHGDLVFVGVSSILEIKRILEKLSRQKKNIILVEKQFYGKEYRLLATKNKFLAATYRIPANIIGDSKKTIKALIKEKNSDSRRGSGHEKSLVKIKIDNFIKNYLKSKNFTLDFIPKKGQQVFLRPNSNLSTGGDSVDVTDIIHPEVKKLATKVIRSIPGLFYGGIDYLTSEDITKPPARKNYIIIEINDSPMLSMHHIPYQGKSRNVAKEIIKELFPEVENNY